MKALGYALAALACGLLRLAGTMLVAATRTLVLLALPLASWFLRHKQHRPKAVAAPARSDGLQGDRLAPTAPEAVQLASAIATVAGQDGLAVADRIVSLRLDPPVGVIHLRVYQARRVVRRELIVLEPCLRALLKGRRHPLPEVAYDPVDGLEAIKNEAVLAAEAWINTRGNAARQRHPRAAVQRRDQPLSAASQPKANDTPPQPAPATAATLPSLPPDGTLLAPPARTGYCYVGTLVKAGTATVRPKGRAPYDIFEATLQLDNGAELALRGAELQRELAACRCTPGQRIAITPMGKVPVVLANGGEGHKNLYRVQLADAVHADASP